MAVPRKRTLTRKPKDGAQPTPVEPPKPYAALDLGASAIRLVIAEGEGDAMRVIEEVSRGVLIGKDTFTVGKIGQPTVEAALQAVEGFRTIMDTFGVVRYRAVATSALREASNRDTVLDRIRVRTGIDVEVIDGSEENRLTYLAVRESLKSLPDIATETCLVAEVGEATQTFPPSTAANRRIRAPMPLARSGFGRASRPSRARRPTSSG